MKATDAADGGSRQLIIRAALVVALRESPAAVTVDAVMKETGLSRGGVTHHFPSQQALLKEVLAASLRRYAKQLGADDPAPTESARTAAYVSATLDADSLDRVALMLGLAEAPALLDEWIALYRRLDDIERQSDQSPTDAYLRRLAADGLWWTRMTDPERFTPEQFEALLRGVLSWTPSLDARAEGVRA
ncbi:TetR/AcrR family transcriptional regulator [Catenulispora rubra]|uniref:TetR/AcrR family transcriptional regulator n=1 Tax=Catenulispora rubra TaxID=280293 RepID=UPI001891F6BB|nr:TetR/AcrR family transcriptional regulator [Catenulispora rubra]